MSRFLVTGGAGFIGSHLVDLLLSNGHSVRVLDDLSTGQQSNVSTDAEFVHGDIRDQAVLSQCLSTVDGVFHLAAIASVAKSTDDWLGTHSVNLSATIGIFDAIARSRRAVPVVYASSAAVYGNQGDVVLHESLKTQPLSGYGADKLGCELHAAVARTVWGIPSVGFRFFNVYGPRQNPKSDYSGVISIFVDRALKGRPISIHGDGQQVRDFVFVQDVVQCLSTGMNWLRRQAAASTVLNVCTGQTTSILALAEQVYETVGGEALVQHGEARAGDIRFSKGDPSLLQATLGLTPSTTLAAGLRQLVDSVSRQTSGEPRP